MNAVSATHPLQYFYGTGRIERGKLKVFVETDPIAHINENWGTFSKLLLQELANAAWPSRGDQVRDYLVRQNREIRILMLKEHESDAEFNAALKRCDAAKALLQSVIQLALPRSWDNNDIVRILLGGGASSSFDSRTIARTYSDEQSLGHEVPAMLRRLIEENSKALYASLNIMLDMAGQSADVPQQLDDTLTLLSIAEGHITWMDRKVIPTPGGGLRTELDLKSPVTINLDSGMEYDSDGHTFSGFEVGEWPKNGLTWYHLVLPGRKGWVCESEVQQVRNLPK